MRHARFRDSIGAVRLARRRSSLADALGVRRRPPGDASRSTGFGATVLRRSRAERRRRAARRRLGVRRLPCRRRAARAAVRARRRWRSAWSSPRAAFAGWLALAAAGSSVALPGVLLWLLVACALKRPLARCRSALQWVAAIGLGALRGGARRASSAALLPTPPGAGLVAARRRPGAGRRGDGGGACSSGCACARRRTLPAETTARLAELQSRIRPHFLFNTLNTALALVRARPGARRGRARRPGRAVPRRASPTAPSRCRWRGGRAGAALPRHRADPLRQPPARELGARRRGRRARACRRCCCSRWSRTRCATASSRRAEGGVIRVRTQGQARPRGARRSPTACPRSRRGPATAWRCTTCASGCA